MAKRLRILAGPNGLGKTSIYRGLRDKFNWGVFVNADEIEKALRECAELNLSAYGVCNTNFAQFELAFNQSLQAQKSRCVLSNIDLVDDVLTIKDSNLLDSYFSAFVASYIQSFLINAGASFSFETVMSHPSKLDVMLNAKEKGYRVYLYYVSTLSPEINIGRVAARVAEGGHNVEEDKIRSRYYRSLGLLRDAISIADRAYVFDNSGKSNRWIAEYNGSDGRLTVYSNTDWFNKYVLDMLS